MSHTPGPWQVCDTEDCGNPGCAAIYDTKGCGIFAPDDDTRPDAEVRSNAVLAAAAPDLLAAIGAFLEADRDREFADTVDLDEYAMQWAEALNGLKAAAAKARGAS